MYANFYEKKIIYLKSGEINAGFAKIICRNGRMSVEINVNWDKDSSAQAFFGMNGNEQKLIFAKILIHNKKAYYKIADISMENVLGSGMEYRDIKEIIIETEAGDIISGEVRRSDEIEAAAEVEEALNEQENDCEEKGCLKEEIHISSVETLQSEPTLKVYDSKWQHLWEIYPHISPFNDSREYLSISPADFVLFTSDSYVKANNSFMMHGFHNYKHLILRCQPGDDESKYYVGTPGVYYDNEKQAAIMFGYDSFEGNNDSATVGDFGYYLMPIRL